MTTLTEKRHTGGFLISEAEGRLSRDNATLISGQNLQAGTVLGKITTGGKWTQVDDSQSDGSETARGVLYASVDASGGDTPCVVITRDAEVNGHELIWPASSPQLDLVEGYAELALQHIIVRD